MDFKQELIEFKNHLGHTTDEIINVLDGDEEANLEKFDIVITVNGKSIQIPANADVFSTLDLLIDDEIRDGN